MISSKLDSYLLLCIQQCLSPEADILRTPLKPYASSALYEYTNLLIGYEKEEIYTSIDHLVPPLVLDPHLYNEDQRYRSYPWNDKNRDID